MMFNRFIKKTVFFSLFFASVFIFGCGGNSSIENNNITGNVTAGPVAGATVTAYKSGGKLEVEKIGTTQTDENGNYSIPNPTNYTGLVYLEATGGSYTDEATETDTGLEISLHSATKIEEPSAQISITPFTEMAVVLAEGATEGINEVNMENMNKKIAKGFGLGDDFDIIGTSPSNALDASFNDDTEDEKLYGLALAGISQIIATKKAGDEAGYNLEKCLQDFDTDLQNKDYLIPKNANAFKESISTFLDSNPNLTGDGEIINTNIENNTPPSMDTAESTMLLDKGPVIYDIQYRTANPGLDGDTVTFTIQAKDSSGTNLDREALEPVYILLPDIVEDYYNINDFTIKDNKDEDITPQEYQNTSEFDPSPVYGFEVPYSGSDGKYIAKISSTKSTNSMFIYSSINKDYGKIFVMGQPKQNQIGGVSVFFTTVDAISSTIAIVGKSASARETVTVEVFANANNLDGDLQVLIGAEVIISGTDGTNSTIENYTGFTDGAGKYTTTITNHGETETVTLSATVNGTQLPNNDATINFGVD